MQDNSFGVTLGMNLSRDCLRHLFRVFCHTDRYFHRPSKLILCLCLTTRCCNDLNTQAAISPKLGHYDFILLFYWS